MAKSHLLLRGFRCVGGGGAVHPLFAHPDTMLFQMRQLQAHCRGGENGGALPAAHSAGLPKQCGGQPAATATSPIFSRARESPREVLLWGEGNNNPPLPAQNSGSLPVVSWGEGDRNHPLPTQAAGGHVGDAMGKGKPSSPFPSDQPRAAAPAGPR